MYDYLDKWYHVILKHKTDSAAPRQRLSFRLINTPVTELWLETIRETIADPNFKVYYNQMATFIPTLEKIHSIWDEMYQGVQAANSKQWVDVDYISMPEHFNPDENPQALLNHLHYEFHRFEEAVATERWRVINDAYDPLQIVNVLIHKLEQMTTMWFSNFPLDKTLLVSTFFIHRINPNDGNPLLSVRSIPNELYQYWNPSDADGVLLLGYHTIGKNLFHCYKDNDVNLVKMNMIRPQINLGTETQMYFGGWPTCDQQAYLEGMHQWVKDNHLEAYVDSHAPQHSVSQQPLLGKIQNNLSRQEISDFFEYYQIETVELEE
jgi:hypothetical protein